MAERVTPGSGAETVTWYVWGLDLSQSVQEAGGIGGLLLQDAGTETRLYTYEANGNVGQLVDGTTGAVVAHYEYDPFGTTLTASGTAAEANPFRFSTKYTDADTNLLYYGYRFYSPYLGRWLTRDPIEEEGGINLYGFVSNNAINKKDYLGMTKLYIRNGRPCNCCFCGPDVTDAVDETLQDIYSTFHNAHTDKEIETRKTACSNLYNLLEGIASDEWDIKALHAMNHISTALKVNPHWKGIVKEGIPSYPCGETVQYHEKCFKGNTLNYIMWGTMNRACADMFGNWGWRKPTTIASAPFYKLLARIVDSTLNLQLPTAPPLRTIAAISGTSYNHPTGGVPIPRSDMPMCKITDDHSLKVPDSKFNWRWKPLR